MAGGGFHGCRVRGCRRTSADHVSSIVLPFRSLGGEAGPDVVADVIVKGTSPRPPTGRPIVVGLPFDDIGADKEQNYFVDGLTADPAA
jgi:hypothetical protein